MSPERWRQVEELYHSALECGPAQRTAFLTEACKGDDGLRREVESLLAQPSGDGPLARPAWEGAETLLELTVTQIVPGAQLGPYKIEAPLGAGGMGEVFRGRDTRLGRAVAIKVVQEKFSTRFEREARAISALNHPYICTLYDVGPNYLVMELCEGETLAARLKRGKLSIQETLRYGAQIADALAARACQRDHAPRSEAGQHYADESRREGVGFRLGTPAYMAPEQASC